MDLCLSMPDRLIIDCIYHWQCINLSSGSEFAFALLIAQSITDILCQQENLIWTLLQCVAEFHQWIFIRTLSDFDCGIVASHNTALYSE